ncbi:MarR family winged helix-turn-helix transcriptional regulator [Nosocomiicoccus ampullae]|uniref:DNA-binding MarR family transcriptional regulator n=1 Tax=Nosocomiicoccus ampullae TaxID=489910 RepID=A0A9Q2CY29_9STAP|nr:MarR family transcriptional regulator [Nosocomiicoccus ampullae]MBB5175323.1 DNA-binding MarR family transcriptional regulator [Nosocomiicoccus ampullae]QYA46304.1 MarR family transcriptional regulator [Nosocomiicoccus ampullae]QYA47804.1 MarR family transcriptional regulator [Nosocomiicoccus ampullae]
MSFASSNESIEKSLRKLSVQLRLYGREILKEYKLSKIQFIALQWVNDSSGITIGQVAKNLDLAYSTTTDIIDRLEKNGFVRRERSKTDKRLVQVKIEPTGLELIERVIEKRIEFIEEITQDLDLNEKELLTKLLEKMMEKSELVRYE